MFWKWLEERKTGENCAIYWFFETELRWIRYRGDHRSGWAGAKDRKLTKRQLNAMFELTGYTE